MRNILKILYLFVYILLIILYTSKYQNLLYLNFMVLLLIAFLLEKLFFPHLEELALKNEKIFKKIFPIFFNLFYFLDILIVLCLISYIIFVFFLRSQWSINVPNEIISIVLSIILLVKLLNFTATSYIIFYDNNLSNTGWDFYKKFFIIFFIVVLVCSFCLLLAYYIFINYKI